MYCFVFVFRVKDNNIKVLKNVFLSEHFKNNTQHTKMYIVLGQNTSYADRNPVLSIMKTKLCL